MAMIPPFFMDCVVAIGVDDPGGKRSWVASGFLYGERTTVKETARTKAYRVYLITNRHVLEGWKRVYLRFNPQSDEPAVESPVDLLDSQGKPLWTVHPNSEIDVAAIPINFQALRDHALQVAFFQADQHVATTGKLNELGVVEGDFVYVLGFPMGLAGDRRGTVIVRSGTLARIRDTLKGTNPRFLVDAFVFPGNSGGPVILKPEAAAIEGTPAQNAAYLIGIVYSYVPYQDVAMSLQTKRPRVVFEENSGLAAVYPIDFVKETVRLAMKKEPVQ